MKRIQLFEFEDFAWLPKTIRTSITNLIIVFHKLMGTSAVLSELILEAKSKSDFSKIVDLGSGSGGPMLEVIKNLNEQNVPVELMLTDLHPNPEVVKETKKLGIKNLSYYEQSVNATDFSQTPTGLKTMVCSFHHMPPETAKKILQSAQESKEPILIYEVAENSIPLIAWWLFLPLSLMIIVIMVLFMTPFVKPLTLKQLAFTYLIPIIPFVYAWDGQASLVRTYTFEDVEHLLSDFKNDDYVWKIDKAKKANGKNLGYYVMGYPK